MMTTSAKTLGYRAQLERVRHCIDVTITHLTTVKAVIPTDEELQSASPSRAISDDKDLARHRENLEAAMQDLAKLARLVVDQARSSAGLDPQCCDWPTLEDSTKGEC
jgi:hypothetical protein